MVTIPKEFRTTYDVLDFAIQKEEDSASFYEALAERVNRPVMRMVLLEFAAEERMHRDKLLTIRNSGLRLLPTGKELETMGISKHIKSVKVDTNVDMAQALRLAMREEKAAFILYFKLAEMTKDRDMRLTLLALAEEEAKHKLRFELEYEDFLFEHGLEE